MGRVSLILVTAISIALIAVAGLLISAETAIGRVTRGRIEDLPPSPQVDRLLFVLEDRARYVNVLLFLSTLASVSAFVLVSYEFIDWMLNDLGWSFALAFVVVILILVVISYVGLGVAPRTLGRIHAERIALIAAGPAGFFAAILGPVTTLLIVIGNALTPGKGFREGPWDTEADLRELVDLAGEDSLIEDDERQMIHSVFELGETYAREVMVPRTDMVFIERHKTLRQAMSLGLRSSFSRIPVIGENSDDVVGVIYLKDIVRRVFEYRDAEHQENVDDLMRSAYFVPDSKQVDELLKDMQAARVHMAIVVDEYGGTAGLVTIEDILEEIVGEIADEYDTEAPEVADLPDGGYRVMARMNIDDFADLIDVDIDSEEEDVDSVIGLMAKKLGRVPIAQSTIDLDGWTLVAELGTSRRNRISFVRAIPHPELLDSEAQDQESDE
ncbi:MAG: hemolysin family protein [Candidatus Nanopelagicales bacterium]|nr:hemolysin family protein [Candidatus Nanopelagicales bacterium]